MTGQPVPAPLWTGVGVALVTLFDDTGAVDNAATAAHAARLVEAGVRGVLVAGTTGEADALTDTERVALIRAVRDAVPDVPLLAGAGGVWSRQAAERAEAAVAAGADAVLVPPPHRPTDLVAFYRAVAAAAAPAPVLGYHYPGIAGGALPVEALPDLPLAGIKDSTGQAELLLREVTGWSGATYVGSSALVTMAAAVGAAGAILAVANGVPELCVAAFDGDGGAQRELLAAHLRAKAPFPHGVKSLAAERYGTSTHSRLG